MTYLLKMRLISVVRRTIKSNAAPERAPMRSSTVIPIMLMVIKAFSDPYGQKRCPPASPLLFSGISFWSPVCGVVCMKLTKP